ncbi:DMT family transporter [Methylobacterium sp. WSM2598]|uniref:DMT family transporter n=1 Tax=Methylobacterium sp. WSM2598 TaxID=398261 RepID=UPI0003682F58|nr:EamA family transporter [Methylobacterium sp. WSM2598]
MRTGGEGGRVAAFLLMALIWGLTWLPTKLAAEVVPPVTLALFRFTLAGLGYLVLALRLPLRMEQPGRILLASLLITTGSYGLLFWGVARAPTGLSAVVNLGLMPIFIVLVGALYGEERITGRRLGAIGLGLAGLLLLYQGRRGGGSDEAGLGLAAVAAGTLSYAWGAVASRPLMRRMHPVALAFWETSLGALGLVPVALLAEGYDPGRLAGLADPRVAFGLGLMVLGGSLAAFTIYLWLVRAWGAFRAGLYAFVSPAVAVAVGVAAGGEVIGRPEALGMAVLLAATALALAERRPAPAPAASPAD